MNVMSVQERCRRAALLLEEMPPKEIFEVLRVLSPSTLENVEVVAQALLSIREAHKEKCCDEDRR